MWIFVIAAAQIGGKKQGAAIGTVFADADIAGQVNGFCGVAATAVSGLKCSRGDRVTAAGSIYDPYFFFIKFNLHVIH